MVSDSALSQILDPLNPLKEPMATLSQIDIPPNYSLDQHFTDPLVAKAVVERLDQIFTWDRRASIFPIRRILEPSCGRGAFVKVLREKYPNAEIVACDIDESMRDHAMAAGANKFVCMDFQNTKASVPFDLICGNFPFILAEEHYHHALTLLRDGGCVSSILLLSFLASSGRSERVWGVNARQWCYTAPIVPRPSFNEAGTTDAREYANFAWFKGKVGMNVLGLPIIWR